MAQRTLERSMMGLLLKDRVPNMIPIRQRTKAKDIIDRIGSLKWNWSGHIVRRSGEND